MTRGADLLDEALSGLTPAMSPQYTEAYKNRIREFEMSYNGGDILVEVTDGSVISLDGFGIHAGYPIPASMRNGEVRILVSEGASVTGHLDGIRLATGGIVNGMRQHFVHVAGDVAGQSGAGVHPVAGGTVTVARTGGVSGTTGIRFSGGTGNGDFPATNNVARVDGEVRSTGPAPQAAQGQPPLAQADVTHAGIVLEGGGKVIVGPQARITAGTGVAILGMPWGARPDSQVDVVVVIEPGDRIEQRIQGTVRNFRGADGSLRVPRIYVKPGDHALPLTAGSTMPLGVWDVVSRQSADGDVTFTSEYGARARVYEALPFVLADQTRPTTHGERMKAAPDRSGFWVRATHGAGRWNARTSTTGRAAYEHDRSWLEGGVDIPVGESITIGISGQRRLATADIGGVGSLTLATKGMGLSGTLDSGRFYIDGRVAASHLVVGGSADPSRRHRVGRSGVQPCAGT